MTDMGRQAEELARALDAFANELDPYGYMDTHAEGVTHDR